jgi:hypothetical protein
LSSCADPAVAEVVALHGFLQNWFNGVLPKTRGTFTRLASAWPPAFALLAPNGELRSSTELLQQTFEEHGAYPQLRIQVRNAAVRLRLSEDLCVISYQEWHTDITSVEGRACSAILDLSSRDPEGPLWLYLHESSLSNASAA